MRLRPEGSAAMLAVFIESPLDAISGLALMLTWYIKSKGHKRRYSVGKARLEPLSVVGMACLMTEATLITLEQSIAKLIAGENASRS